MRHHYNNKDIYQWLFPTQYQIADIFTKPLLEDILLLASFQLRDLGFDYKEVH